MTAEHSAAIVRSLLETIRAPRLPVDRIARQVERDYGLAGDWRPLGGEREQNFQLVTAEGTATSWPATYPHRGMADHPSAG